MESFSAIKRYKILIHTIMWINTELLGSSKRSSVKDHLVCDSIYVKNLEEQIS